MANVAQREVARNAKLFYFACYTLTLFKVDFLQGVERDNQMKETTNTTGVPLTRVQMETGTAVTCEVTIGFCQ